MAEESGRRQNDREVRDLVIEQGTLLHEIARRLIIIEDKMDSKPCSDHAAKLRMQDRIITGLLAFSGTVLITLLTNMDKIKRAFS